MSTGHAITPRQTITLNGVDYETTFTRKFANRKPYVPKDPKRLCALIPGLVLYLTVKPGDQVRRGQRLLVLEAMKMQNHITAPADGLIMAIHVAAGDTLTKGQLMVEFE